MSGGTRNRVKNRRGSGAAKSKAELIQGEPLIKRRKASLDVIRTCLKNRYFGNQTAIRHFGKLLENYYESGFAPPHLLAELTTGDEGKFWAHVWEAILFRHLWTLGFSFKESRVTKSGQKGPDFGITCGEKTIWIEAAVPAPIDIPVETLEPPPSDLTNINAIKEPDAEKLLRWTAKINDKNKKFSEYLNEGIISEEDCTVIAVNSCRLQDFAVEDTGISGFPYAVEATFPIGPRAYWINSQGQPDGLARNLFRPSVLKKNGANIATGNFLDPHFGGISAVLGTHQRELLKGRLHFSLAHNPLAKNQLPRQILGATKEFVCELAEEHFTLRNLICS